MKPTPDERRKVRDRRKRDERKAAKREKVAAAKARDILDAKRQLYERAWRFAHPDGQPPPPISDEKASHFAMLVDRKRRPVKRAVTDTTLRRQHDV